jgi:ZIP family zinc transporter
MASSALVVGGIIGSSWRVNRQVTGVLLAFASGTLLSALAFELFPVAVAKGGMPRSAVGLVLGASAFVVANWWVDQRVLPLADGEEESRASKKAAERAVSFALLASVTLDGIPENLALGAGLQAGAGAALPLAIFASNFPEALVGTVAMRRGGESAKASVFIWVAAAVVLTAMAVLGEWIAGGLTAEGMAWLLSFGGGAVLASLADTLMPEAFQRGRPWNSFATAAGFLTSFALAHP